MKKVIAVSISLLIGILVLAGCQANGNTSAASNPSPAPAAPPAPWTPADSLEDISYASNTPANIIVEGRRTYQSSCSACHDAPTTQRIKEFGSNEELIKFTIPMTEAAGLPLEHSEKLIRYMLAVHNDNLP